MIEFALERVDGQLNCRHRVGDDGYTSRCGYHFTHPQSCGHGQDWMVPGAARQNVHDQLKLMQNLLGYLP